MAGLVGVKHEESSVDVHHGSADWILMNPPYSRTRGGQSAFDLRELDGAGPEAVPETMGISAEERACAAARRDGGIVSCARQAQGQARNGANRICIAPHMRVCRYLDGNATDGRNGIRGYRCDCHGKRGFASADRFLGGHRNGGDAAGRDTAQESSGRDLGTGSCRFALCDALRAMHSERRGRRGGKGDPASQGAVRRGQHDASCDGPEQRNWVHYGHACEWPRIAMEHGRRNPRGSGAGC